MLHHHSNDGDNVLLHSIRDDGRVILKVDLPEAAEQVAIQCLGRLILVFRLVWSEFNTGVHEKLVTEVGPYQNKAISLSY